MKEDSRKSDAPQHETAPAAPFSHPVPVATLHGETHLVLRPAEPERAAIAKALGLDSVESLTLDIGIRHAQSGLVSIEGRLAAKVNPLCVVTLEPFPQEIDVPLSIRFAPQPVIDRLTRRAEEDGVEDFDPPDLIEDGKIDFGALATEFLALSLDPYPRKPGATFAGAGDAPVAKESPFAVLAALRGKKPDET